MSVSYEDFAKLDIKIGTIIAVAVVEEADRLLCLMVEIGEDEPRQIISAIREFFPQPEELIGRQCPFLINLEPRKIKGLESQGMILAVGENTNFSLVHPGQPVPAGTRIH